jgi:hypothetical protein
MIALFLSGKIKFALPRHISEAVVAFGSDPECHMLWSCICNFASMDAVPVPWPFRKPCSILWNKMDSCRQLLIIEEQTFNIISRRPMPWVPLDAFGMSTYINNVISLESFLCQRFVVLYGTLVLIPCNLWEWHCRFLLDVVRLLNAPLVNQTDPRPFYFSNCVPLLLFHRCLEHHHWLHIVWYGCLSGC